MKITRVNRVVKKSSHMARKKRRIELTKKVIIIGFIVALFLGAFLYGLYRPEINIRGVEVRGTTVLKPEAIESAVRQEISGKYFYLIPKSNILFFPEETLMLNLRDAFKRIDKISVERPNFSKIIINLSERPEHYLWCGRDFIEERSSEDPCYFVDSGGYVFSKAPFYSGNMFLEFYGLLFLGENLDPVGGTVVPEDKFRKLVDFSVNMSKLGLSPTKVLIKTDDDYELSLTLSGKILINDKNDLSKTAEYLEIALSTNPLKSEMKSKRKFLDYLDARFGNKIFFRFKQ